MSIRPVTSISQAQPTLEGAGVKLHRAFGFGDPDLADPFLLFDDFQQRTARGFSARLSMASPSRHRDDHLCAFRYGGTWRLAW